jgi:ankyrin repeat protein
VWHRDDNELTPLAAAVLNEREHHVDALLGAVSGGSSDQLTEYVNVRAKVYTPLMIAAARPVFPILVKLLESGADPNVRSRFQIFVRFFSAENRNFLRILALKFRGI